MAVVKGRAHAPYRPRFSPLWAKKRSDPYLTSYIKMNSKWIKELNVRSKPIKTLTRKLWNKKYLYMCLCLPRFPTQSPRNPPRVLAGRKVTCSKEESPARPSHDHKFGTSSVQPYSLENGTSTVSDVYLRKLPQELLNYGLQRASRLADSLWGGCPTLCRWKPLCSLSVCSSDCLSVLFVTSFRSTDAPQFMLGLCPYNPPTLEMPQGENVLITATSLSTPWCRTVPHHFPSWFWG